MFRFTVRDWLWLTLVVAVGLGWLVREIHLQATIAKMEKGRDLQLWRYNH